MKVYLREEYDVMLVERRNLMCVSIFLLFSLIFAVVSVDYLYPGLLSEFFSIFMSLLAGLFIVLNLFMVFDYVRFKSKVGILVRERTVGYL